MTARIPAPDFRHLSLWPATGARYGELSFSSPARRVKDELPAGSPHAETPDTHRAEADRANGAHRHRA